MATRWSENSYYNFGEGIYRITSPADPKFPDQALFDALNIVYNGDSDNPATMYGSTRLGSTDMGGVVSGLFDHDSGSKLIATNEDGKIYEYGADWAQASGARSSGNSTTSGVRWTHTMFYGATTSKNLSILCNGVDAPVKYDTTNGAVALGGSPPSTGNFPVAWEGRLWLFDGSTAYYSAPNNCEDWSTAGGGGSLQVYRGFDGDITGAVAFADNLIIFKRSTAYRIAPNSTYTSAKVLNLNVAKGCISHNTIKEVAGSDVNALVWWSEHGIESIRASSVGARFVSEDAASWVQPIATLRRIEYMNRAWALFNLERMEYFTCYTAGTSATNPNVGLLGNFARQRKRARWTRTNLTNLTCGVTYNAGNTDYIQYVGDTNGRVYKMHDTTTNLWLGNNWLRRMQTKFHMMGAPNRMKKLGHSFVATDAQSSSNITVRQILLRQNLNVAPTANNTALSNLVTGGWGVGQWGTALWGGGGYAGERIRPDAFSRGQGIQHLIETNDSFYTLRGITVASKMLSNKTY